MIHYTGTDIDALADIERQATFDTVKRINPGQAGQRCGCLPQVVWIQILRCVA
jgi:hypothetical protein